MMVWKRLLLLNMAIFGIYVKFLGCKGIYFLFSPFVATVSPSFTEEEVSLDHRGELMLPDDFSVISKANCSHQVQRQFGAGEGVFLQDGKGSRNKVD